MTPARRNLHVQVATLMAASAALVITSIPTDAFGRGGRGGGGGGRAAASSVHRGGGGGAQRASATRPQAGARQAGTRPQAATRPAGGARASQGGNTATRGGNTLDRGGNTANRGGNTVNRGGNTVERGGNRVNTGNVNIGNDVNIDVDHGWDNNGWDYHPVARGVAFGTAAAVTSAVVGSMIYSLPPSCANRPYGGVTYSYCNGVWYQPQYAGSSVTYIVVNPPY